MLGWLRRLGKKKEPPPPTPEEDAALAEAALRRGELEHAAFHLGAALTADPERAEWLATLDRLLDIAPDPLAVAPLAKENFVGTLAVRAYTLHRLRRTSEALGLILQCARAKPETAYLRWAARWLAEAPEAMGEVPSFLSALIHDHDQGKPPPSELTAFLEVLLATPLGQTDAELRFFVAGVLRRYGQPERAIALARESYAAHPDFLSAVALGAALRETDPEGAIRVYHEAAQYNPDEVSTLLDIGDLEWQCGNSAAAQAAYEQVLAREPQQPWARASLLALTDPEALEAYAAANPENDRAQYLAHREGFYFGNTLLEPCEAITNLVREHQDQLAQGEKFEVTLSAIEAPSAVWAVRRQLAKRGFTGAFSITVTAMGKPDPRLPRRVLSHPLWRYEGTDPHPAVAPPRPEVAAVVAAQAAKPYDFDFWCKMAKVHARALGPTAIPDLHACLALPPENPTDLPEWDWTQRVNLCAALILAHLDRKVLLDLLAGPVDGSVEAAAVALVACVRETPALEEEVTRELLATLKQVEYHAVPSLHAALICSLLQFPSLKPVLRQKLVETLKSVIIVP